MADTAVAPGNALMSPQQLADYLGVPVATVYRWRVGGHENLPTGGHEKSPPVAMRRSPLAATSSPHPLIVARCRGSPGRCGRPS